MNFVVYRAFSVAAARTWNSLSRPHPLCLFSEVASRLSSLGVSFYDFYRNLCSACAVTVVILGHLNRSFYLLTYLLMSCALSHKVQSWSAIIAVLVMVCHYTVFRQCVRSLLGQCFMAIWN